MIGGDFKNLDVLYLQSENFLIFQQKHWFNPIGPLTIFISSSELLILSNLIFQQSNLFFFCFLGIYRSNLKYNSIFDISR